MKSLDPRRGIMGSMKSLAQFVGPNKCFVNLISFAPFQVDGYPIYSMATPTIAGAKGMLAYLIAKPIVKGAASQKVIVTDLREEAVVYINGTPFVLRELDKPVHTLKHVGITGSVVCLCSALVPSKTV